MVVFIGAAAAGERAVRLRFAIVRARLVAVVVAAVPRQLRRIPRSARALDKPAARAAYQNALAKPGLPKAWREAIEKKIR